MKLLPQFTATTDEFKDRLLVEQRIVRPNVMFIMQELERCFPKLRKFTWSEDRAFDAFQKAVERSVLSARLEAVLANKKDEYEVLKTIKGFTEAVAQRAREKALEPERRRRPNAGQA